LGLVVPLQGMKTKTKESQVSYLDSFSTLMFQVPRLWSCLSTVSE